MTITFLGIETKRPEKVTLVRVRLNPGGYTDAGHYYGVGIPLFWYCVPLVVNAKTPKGVPIDIKKYSEGHVRGRDREDAKQQVRNLFPRRRLEFYV